MRTERKEGDVESDIYFGGLILPVAALCAAMPAEAADLGSFFSSPQTEAPTQPVDFGTGWYIRGDGAWAADSLPQISPDLTQFVTNSRQSMFNADLGFGYKLNNWFRADIVADYWLPTRAQGNGATAECITQLNGTPPIPDETVYDDCTPHANSQIQRLDALANLYVDLGTWSGFTPYVGGGLGVSRISNHQRHQLVYRATACPITSRPTASISTGTAASI